MEKCRQIREWSIATSLISGGKRLCYGKECLDPVLPLLHCAERDFVKEISVGEISLAEVGYISIVMGEPDVFYKAAKLEFYALGNS